MYALKYTLEDGQEKFICHAHKTDVFVLGIISECIRRPQYIGDFLKDKTIVIISPPDTKVDDDVCE